MIIRVRTAFFIFLGFLLLWFLYVEAAILTPFILASIFAYIFNPVVNFFSQKVKFPRTVAILIIYALIITLLVYLGLFLSARIVDESSQLRLYAGELLRTARDQINNFPDFIRPTILETLTSLERTKLLPQTLFPFFPAAILRIIGIFIFVFSGYYFLKEGRGIFDKLLHFIPNNYTIEIDVLVRRINAVLEEYLRGQLLLIFIVSVMLYIALSILGVKFSLILAILSGFLEIVPLIGPVIAAIIAALVAFVGGASHFLLNPIQAMFLVFFIYFVVRQIQDYFITPRVMGKITKLHPLIVVFAIVAGEHIMGILGLILAIPIAATIKILLEYGLDKVNQSSIKIS